MESVSDNWLTKQLQRYTLLPMARLSLPMGDRLWGFAAPRVTTVESGEVFIEESARLVSFSDIEQSVRSTDSAVLGSWGQSEHPKVVFEVANDDGAMSEMVGNEYTLNQPAKAYLTYPGLTLQDALSKLTGRVQRWELTAERLLVEFAPQ